MSDTINITSTNIRVFPTVKRENTDPGAKFTTEYNLTSILNKLLDTKAFVISNWTTKDTAKESTIPFDFNIMGYFFSIANIVSEIEKLPITTNHGFINATITVNQTFDPKATDFKNWWQLQGEDSDQEKYAGLQLSFEDRNTFTHISDTTASSENKHKSYNRGDLIDNILVGSDTDRNATYKFTLLHCAVTTQASTGNKTYKLTIPQESKIKLQTSKDGIQHSLAIDDGELEAPPVDAQVARYAMPYDPTVEPTGLEINTNSMHLKVNNYFRLEASLTPARAAGVIVYKTTDASIATVSDTGLITGKKPGTAYIVASCGSFNKTCQITVNQ